MAKTFRILVNILTILALLIGSVVILQTSYKIFKTSVNLAVLSDNAQFYNEQARKTDEMTEQYLENHAERQKIYNSEDFVIRTFSNQNGFVKVLILIVAIIMIPMVILMWVCHILRKYYSYRRRKAIKAKQASRRVATNNAEAKCQL